jgi:hypothetical protein
MGHLIKPVTDMNKQPIISLFDKTGNAVKPWAEAGHPCYCFDIQHSIRADRTVGNITYCWANLLATRPGDLPGNPYAVFAFPECTQGAVSGSRDWKRKGLSAFIAWLTMFEKARELCEWFGCRYLIEQPIVDSSIAKRWREPDVRFHPWQYGDGYTKHTNLWTGGGFVMPEPTVLVEPQDVDDRIHKATPGPGRADFRSASPPKTFRAIYEANKPG